MGDIFVLGSEEERLQLHDIVRKGKQEARVMNRARILLKLAQGKDEEAVAEDVFMSKDTVRRIRLRYNDGGLQRALYDLPRSGQPPIVTTTVEAHLVAVACSNPPKGRARWTLELLAKKLVTDGKVVRISSTAILNHLRKRGIKPWREKNVVHPQAE